MSEFKMVNHNTVSIMGRLTGDYELQSVGGNGTQKGRFSIAVNRSYRKGDDWEEETSFFNCSVWAEQAVRLEARVNKGTPVLVNGRLRSYAFTNDQGNEIKGVEIVCDRVNPLVKDVGLTQEGEEPPQVNTDTSDLPF